MNFCVSHWLRWWGGTPCFRIHGQAAGESNWRQLDVFATHRRNFESRWPLWRGTCITWSDSVIVVGWDFAETLWREQRESPASRQCPVRVAGGRLQDVARRAAAGGASMPSASEILAHECGHSFQALQLGAAYLPLVGSVTWFREGSHWWNHFENRASEEGLFGGFVSVHHHEPDQLYAPRGEV